MSVKMDKTDTESAEKVNNKETQQPETKPSNSMDYQHRHIHLSSTMFDWKGGILPQIHHQYNVNEEFRNPLVLSQFSGNMSQKELYDYHGAQSISPDPAKSPSPPPRVFKPCVVCNDKSSGYHYGVSSCEGCKGFFRRSVSRNIQYTCQKDSMCEINKVTRNRCQHCRLKKCFEKGMSKEAVRNDRKKKPTDSEAKDSLNNNVKPAEPVSYLTEENKMILEKILESQRNTLPGGFLLNNRMRKKCSSVSTESPSSSTCSNNAESSESKSSPDTTDDIMGFFSNPDTPGPALGSPGHRPGWDNVQELNSEGIVKVVEFAKNVPSFLELPVSDQITLLKASCLEIMILRLVMRYSMEENVITFSNGVSVSVTDMEKGGFGSLAQTIFKFSTSLHEMGLDEQEFALLAVICLLSSDRIGLSDSANVEKVQEPYLNALSNYTKQKHLKKPHQFANLLMKLTDLRSISIKGADKLLHLRQDSPLVIEMFDRPENIHIS